MSNTRRYTQLSKRISKIEISYLPAINPTGNYSAKQQDDLRAYLLLVHAEIESYFEEISESKVRSAFNNWRLHRTKSNVLIALASFCDGTVSDLSLEVRVNKALTFYIAKLRHNHGIKEKNLLDMLLPIGLEHSDIDATWLSTMNSFGSSRGMVAHSAAMVQQPLDPVLMKNTVTLILTEIGVIDEKIKKIQ